jgi:hypothetical protein
MARLLLGAAVAAGVDARRLAADARLPGWVLGWDRAMIPQARHSSPWVNSPRNSQQNLFT